MALHWVAPLALSLLVPLLGQRMITLFFGEHERGSRLDIAPSYAWCSVAQSTRSVSTQRMHRIAVANPTALTSKAPPLLTATLSALFMTAQKAATPSESSAAR